MLTMHVGAVTVGVFARLCLQALLTQPDLADAGPPSVVIRNAYIDGALDFEGARIRASQVAFQGCRLAGDLMAGGCPVRRCAGPQRFVDRRTLRSAPMALSPAG